MAIGKPLLVDQGRKEQGTVLSAQITPLSTQVAAQKLSFADYSIGQANAKASFAVSNELVNMAGAIGKAAVYIDKTKKEHARLGMMQGWQESDDKYAQEFASAITYEEKAGVASRMQKSIGARAKNYQSIGGSSLDAQKSLAALTNASRSSLSKMNISSAQRLVTETNTGYDVEAKRISRVIATDRTADMGVQFEKYRVLQNSKIASQLITPEQAEFQQIDFQRIAHTARGKLLGREYADNYINSGAPLPSDEDLIESYQKNTGLILDDVQKNMFTDSIDDIYAKKLREYNSIEEAEIKGQKLQNYEQKETLMGEIGAAYTKGEATPKVIEKFLETAKSFGDPNFKRKVDKFVLENAYGASDQNVLGEYTTPDKMQEYTGKDFMKNGMYDIDAISQNLPRSANGRTKTEILKFYHNLNGNLSKNFVRTVPNSANAALASLLERDTGDQAFIDAFKNFDDLLFGSITSASFKKSVNYKDILQRHPKFSSVYNGVLAKADALSAKKAGVFSDEYLKEHGPEERAKELQKVLALMFKEDIQKVVDEENKVKDIAKVKKDEQANRDYDSRVMQELEKKQRMKDEGDKIRRETSENFRKYKDEERKRRLIDDAKIEEGLKPLTDLVISTDKSIGDTVDELLQPVDKDLVNIFEAMGKGIEWIDKSVEDFMHSIITYTDHRVSKDMRKGWDKTNEDANAPEAVPTPATGKGLSEPIPDEMLSQYLEDNARNIEQSGQAPTAFDQLIEGASDNPIINQAVETVSSVLGLGGTAEAAIEPDATMSTTQSPPPADDPARPIHELPTIDSISRREATPEQAINKVQDNGKAGGYGHTFRGNERSEWEAHPPTTEENIDWRRAKASEWLESDVARFEGFADNMVQEWETANDATASPLLKGVLTRMNYQLGEGWRSKFPSAWKGIMAGSGSGTTPMFADKTGWEQAIYHLKNKNESSRDKSDWNIETPSRVEDAVLGIQAIAGDQSNSQLKKKEISPPKIKEAIQDKSKIYNYPPKKGKWSKTWKKEAVKLQEIPEAEDAIVALDTIESQDKSSMSYDAAKAASKHVMASLFELAGFDVPKTFTEPINEKTLSKEVVEAGGLIAYKALLGDGVTSYDDMGKASELVDGKKRPKGFIAPLKLMYESFGNAGTTFAFTVGESAGIVVKNGELHIVGDEYDFPNNFNLKGKNAGDGWLMLQKAMVSLSPSSKNRQKIDINLGSLAKIKKRYEAQKRA